MCERQVFCSYNPSTSSLRSPAVLGGLCFVLLRSVHPIGWLEERWDDLRHRRACPPRQLDNLLTIRDAFSTPQESPQDYWKLSSIWWLPVKVLCRRHAQLHLCWDPQQPLGCVCPWHSSQSAVPSVCPWDDSVCAPLSMPADNLPWPAMHQQAQEGSCESGKAPWMWLQPGPIPGTVALPFSSAVSTDSHYPRSFAFHSQYQSPRLDSHNCRDPLPAVRSGPPDSLYSSQETSRGRTANNFLLRPPNSAYFCSIQRKNVAKGFVWGSASRSVVFSQTPQIQSLPRRLSCCRHFRVKITFIVSVQSAEEYIVLFVVGFLNNHN